MKVIYVNCWLRHEYQGDLCSNPTYMHIYKTHYWKQTSFNEEVLLLIHQLLFQMSKFMMLSIWDK